MFRCSRCLNTFRWQVRKAHLIRKVSATATSRLAKHLFQPCSVAVSFCLLTPWYQNCGFKFHHFHDINIILLHWLLIESPHAATDWVGTWQRELQVGRRRSYFEFFWVKSRRKVQLETVRKTNSLWFHKVHSWTCQMQLYHFTMWGEPTLYGFTKITAEHVKCNSISLQCEENQVSLVSQGSQLKLNVKSWTVLVLIRNFVRTVRGTSWTSRTSKNLNIDLNRRSKHDHLFRCLDCLVFRQNPR